MKRPIIFFYSLILPAVWILFSLIFTALFPGRNIGTVGTALMLCGIASLISWVFVRSNSRDFTTSEFRCIILYCIAWALLLEFFVLFFVLAQVEDDSGLNFQALCFVALFTVTLDSLFVWLAFRNFGKRIIKAHLAKLEAASDSKKQEDRG